MSGKYGEPWFSQGVAVADDAGVPVTVMLSSSIGCERPLDERVNLARRIAACVSACAPLSDSALESGVIERVREALEQLIAWRDAVECISPELGGLIVAMDRARAALALLEAKP